MAKPLIGISMQRDWNGEKRSVSVGQSYEQAVLRAGGIPVLLPVLPRREEMGEILARIQGVIVTGGPDINPILYGGRMHPNVKGVDLLRDEADLHLVKLAYELKVPLLGICRGFQVINVAFGGTLYTDVNEQHPGSLFHTCYPDRPLDLLSHSVRLVTGGRLADILQQDELRVNSLHHQGIRTVGAGLAVTAVAEDGLVEGIEISEMPFGLGVQWHPELMPADTPSNTLFRALILAAAGRN